MRYKKIAMIIIIILILWGTGTFLCKLYVEEYDVDKSLLVISTNFAHKIITRANTQEKLVALTFDDGPDPKYTPKILDILKRYDIKATFFVVGENCEVYPDIIKRQITEGHEIENHTFTHPDFKKDHNCSTVDEITHAEKIIEKITGRKPKYFRPPKGLFKHDTVRVAEEKSYRIILWTICLEHKKAKTVEEMADRVIKKAKPGIIILAHDGRLNRDRTVQALPRVIEGYQKKGYKFVTLEYLLNHQIK